LSSLDAAAALTLHHSPPILVISDSSSVFTLDSRAWAQHFSLADAVAAECAQSADYGAHKNVVFSQTLEKIHDICLSSIPSASSAAPAAASATSATVTHDFTAGSVLAVDSTLLHEAWDKQQQQCSAADITCAMVIKRMVSPSTSAAFVSGAAAAGRWDDVMACVRGGGVALSHCPNLVADAAAAGQTPVMLECLLRCVDALEADVACVLTYALHTGTAAAFQLLASYISSAPAVSASAATPSTSSTSKKSKGKSSAKVDGRVVGGSCSNDVARRTLLHAALRSRVSEVGPIISAVLCSLLAKLFDAFRQVSMMPLLRSIPQRAIVRLLRYLRSLMLNDSVVEVNTRVGGKDCDALPSLQRVVEWSSMCMDAVGLQVIRLRLRISLPLV
jgi:hypothetical protein